MAYFILAFCILLGIIGIFIINRISEKSKEIRNNIEFEPTETVEVIDNPIKLKIFEEQNIDINYLHSLLIDMEKERLQEIEDNKLKFKNIKRALDNIEKQQTNFYLSDLLRDNEEKVPSSKELFEYSHLN